ncbi:hypothetical protein [Pseudofrankia saprophytica]|uniref:hypothetical protein n=1 Tax=Pseudofrankia saprophytica TaxID=298655 RepID=UPI00030BD171|nr:hypothetical protein [Pseudofrankia saprophytica]
MLTAARLADAMVGLTDDVPAGLTVLAGLTAVLLAAVLVTAVLLANAAAAR